MREKKSARNYEQEAIDSMKKCLQDNAHVLERYASDESDGKLLQRYLRSNPSPEKEALKKALAGGAPIKGENGLRKQLSSIDLEYFGRAYFPHYFTRPSPEFHHELDRLWIHNVLKGNDPYFRDQRIQVNKQAGKNCAVAAPRGHAKSTNLTFKDTMHAILYGYKHYLIIISDSSDQAEGFLASIKEELEENEWILEDFGNIAGSIWRNDVIVTKTGVKLEAIGSGKKIRGRKHKNWRPDLLVLDDIENDENVRTKEQRKKLYDWFYKAVSKAGDTYTDILYIGTILHYDSLLSSVLKNPSYRSVKYKAVISPSESPALWDIWKEIYTDLANENREQDAEDFFREHKAEMLKGTRVLWEERLDYYALMVKKISEGESSFNSELQNEPINPEDCLFNPEMFDYYNPEMVDFGLKEFDFFGFVDPSLGKTKKSDYSSIITIARHRKTGFMYVVEADTKKRSPSQIIADCINKEIWLRKTYGRGYKKFGCETNQFQLFLKQQMANEAAAHGIYLPLAEVNQTANKEARISTLEPYINNKYLKFNKQHKLLLEQLEQFPLGANDDAPDALEAVVNLATKHKVFNLRGLIT